MTDLDQLSEFYNGTHIFFLWSEVSAVVKSNGRGAPRGSWIYLKGKVDPIILDYQHDSIVRKCMAASASSKSGDLIPLAAHEAAIEAAVLAERERCAADVVEPIHKIVYDGWYMAKTPVTSHSHQKVVEAVLDAIRNPEATP